MKKMQQNEPIAKGLSKRDGEVLRFVVLEYIETAKPVGSKILAEKYLSKWSSATFRNILAKLEKEGFLIQPHASAGRVPSENGFQYYLDHFLEIKDLTAQQKESIQLHQGSLEDAIKNATRFLSNCSHQIGMVTSPRLESTIFKQIQFVRISHDKILAIFIAKNTMIEQRMVHWEEAPSQDELWKMAGYLNEMLSDLTLREVRERIQIELDHERIRYNTLFANALRLQDIFLDQNEELDLFVEGQMNFMKQPEFSKDDRMKFFLQALEEKQTLLKILELAEENANDGTQIVMGKDLNPKELSGLTFVTRSYGSKEKPLGALAIAGPTRMDYCRIVPIVNFTANSLNHLFSEKENPEEPILKIDMSDDNPKNPKDEKEISEDSFTIEGTQKILKDALESFESREKDDEDIEIEIEESAPEKKENLNALGSLMKKKDERLKEAHDRILRLSADFDNFKKRVNRDQQGMIDRAKENYIRGLLPVIDSFDRTLGLQADLLEEISQKAPEAKNILEGFHLIHRQMLSYLQEMQIVPIECLGKPFDPKFHEALSQVETQDFPVGHICQEIQRGYVIKDRLLRPSQVVVAKKSDSEENSPNEDSPSEEDDGSPTPRIKC